ncbi:hypothetical protein RLDS_25890 [Sphingobium lactosutens DS20]|uniref:Uncharacterized protein n=1 Tax=Sphingobium lactosutens DS20 TaxID=1331060 RepID=T0HD35_9SPHN|nr:hypothetical protein RLDS_25890 [Sphingobium lactosutens DS20]
MMAAPLLRCTIEWQLFGERNAQEDRDLDDFEGRHCRWWHRSVNLVGKA